MPSTQSHGNSVQCDRTHAGDAQTKSHTHKGAPVQDSCCVPCAGFFFAVDMSLTSCIDTLPEPLHSTFSLQEKLGSGAYALVYRAQHRVSKESFALKVVQKDELEARQMIPQLRREIEFLTVLSGAPHIVQLHEVVDTRQHLFLRFELCGVNLEDVVDGPGSHLHRRRTEMDARSFGGTLCHAPARAGAPRHQAFQHVAGRGRLCEDLRLWVGLS